MTANAADYTLTWVFANGETATKTVTDGKIGAGDFVPENATYPAPAGQMATG